jgi:hypothetical protein
MPLQGILDDNSFDTMGPPRFRYRAVHRVPVTVPSTVFPLLCRPPCFRYRAVHRVPVTVPSTVFPLLWAPTTCPIRRPDRVPVTGPANHVSDPMP